MGGAASIHSPKHDRHDDNIFHNVNEVQTLFLCTKAATINQLTYWNKGRDKKYSAFQTEIISEAKISDFKAWTYSDFSARVLDSFTGKPSVSAVCCTGKVANISDISAPPIPFICFGGTISLYEVVADCISLIVVEADTEKRTTIGGTGLGIFLVYQTLRAFGLIEYMINELKKNGSGMLVTGHSLGGAMATLFVAELLMDYPDLFDTFPIYLITFGSPRVFDRDSSIRIDALMREKSKFQHWRVVNEKDLIAMLPPVQMHLLYHIGNPIYFGRKDVEIHPGDIKSDFPPDSEDSVAFAAEFVATFGNAHCLSTERGYFPRMITSGTFARLAKKIDHKLEATLGRLMKHCSNYEVTGVQGTARPGRQDFSLINHFFGPPSTAVTTCKMWIKTYRPNFVYPEMVLEEMVDKENLGIALSGGCLAAACLSIGWLRALHQMGILKKAKYLSSVGASAWVHVAMTYDPAKEDLSNFLGPYLPPNKCSIKEVKKAAGTGFCKILAEKDDLFDSVKNAIWRPLHALQSTTVDFWSNAVGNAYLKPLGFNTSGTTLPALFGEHADRIRTLTAGWIDNVYTARPLQEHPFPIVNAAVHVGHKRGCVPVEFTPLYYGVVPRYETKYHGIGGCLIEPHGFTATPDAFNLNRQLVKGNIEAGNMAFDLDIPRPLDPITVHEIAGISSSFLPVFRDDDDEDNKGSVSGVSYDTLNFQTIPTFSYTSPVGELTTRETFVDGRACDNTGILALLRRKCSFIIAGIVANSSLDKDSPAAEDANDNSLGHVAALFGRQASDKAVNYVQNGSFNEQRKVFDSEGWDELIGALRAKQRAGKPTIHRMTLKVLPNPSIAVSGNYTTTLVIVLSGTCAEWTAALAGDTKKLLESDNKEAHLSEFEEWMVALGIEKFDLRGFPFHSTDKFSAASSLSMSLLTQLASHQLISSKELLGIGTE